MTASSTMPISHTAAATGTCLRYDQINDPGAYVCNWTGHLLRVPEDGVKPGRSPVFEIRGKEELFVTKLCDDPYVAITKARMLASNFDLAVNF